MEKNDSEENTEKNAGQPENRNTRYKNETISTSLEFLMSKKGVFTISLISLFILLFSPILEFYNQKVVNPILSKISSAWYIDIWILLLVALSIIATVYLFLKEKRVTNSFFAVSFLLFIVFIYCRFFYGYHFQSFKWFESWYYIDSLFVVFGIVFFLKISNWVISFKEPEYGELPFMVDTPLEYKKESDEKSFDEGRKVLAKRIAEKIQSRLENSKSGSLAIGINGVWGSGKTTFLNNIKRCIDKKNRVVIDFNPWRSTSPARIIEDFFNLLVKELEPYDASLSNSLLGYAKSLTKIEDNIITRTTGALSEFVFGTENKNERYKSINRSIGKIKKQIIMFIDDLDRLDKKEVIEVLRIIRNTADFRNVVYVVVYDREYVLAAIQSFNEYNYRSFLEKIFQFEFFLPMYEGGTLKKRLKEDLIKYLLREMKLEDEKTNNRIDILKTEIERAVNSRYGYGKDFTLAMIKTYRDITLLVNSLVFEIADIIHEVFFYDFYLLQLLKLKFSIVYRALTDYQNYIFIVDTNTKKKERRYRLRKKDDRIEPGYQSLFKMREGDKLLSKEPGKYENNLTEFLKIKKIDFGISDIEIEMIVDLVQLLLEVKDSKSEYKLLAHNAIPAYHEHDMHLSKSFAYPANFHKYFVFNLYEGDISNKDFEDVRRRDIEEYKRKVKEWIADNKYEDLIFKLEKIKEFSEVKEFENHVLILIEIGSIQFGEEIFKNLGFINFDNILKTLKYPLGANGSTLFESPKQYKKFLIDAFEQPGNALVFVSTLIAKLIRDETNVGISTGQLSQINLAHFKKYCDDNDSITSEFRILHQNVIQRKTSTYINSDNCEPIPAAQELFVEYFLKNLRGCELNSWIKHVNGRTDYFTVNEEWVKTFFDKDPIWEPLEEYLKAADNLKKDKDCYEEFMDFFDKFKDEGHKKVEFVFKNLKPNLWSNGAKSNPQ